MDNYTVDEVDSGENLSDNEICNFNAQASLYDTKSTASDAPQVRYSPLLPATNPSTPLRDHWGAGASFVHETTLDSENNLFPEEEESFVIVSPPSHMGERNNLFMFYAPSGAATVMSKTCRRPEYGVQNSTPLFGDNNHIVSHYEPSTAATSSVASSEEEQDSNQEQNAKRRKHGQSFEEKGAHHLETTRLADIIGQGAAKLRIEEMLLPLALPTEIAKTVLTGIRAQPVSILLYGPPGCGKTLLARAIAGEARAAFFPIGPSDVLSKFVGESEASVRDIFAVAAEKALVLKSRCAVIFFDEIDALGQSRVGHNAGVGVGASESCSRRVLAELLLQMNDIADQNGYRIHTRPPTGGGQVHSWLNEQQPHDDYEEEEHVRVIVVAATNRKEDCDDALVRRFGIRVLVDLPNERDRKAMILRHLLGINHNLSKRDFDDLASLTKGLSGSDLESLTREATMTPVRECIRKSILIRKQIAKKVYAQKKEHTEAQRDAEESSIEPDTEARTILLKGFETLRPVQYADFEQAAIRFYHAAYQINPQSAPISEQTMACSQQHYDTSSDEDSDTEE